MAFPRLRRVLAPLAILSLAAPMPAAAEDDLSTLVTRLAKIGRCLSPSFSPDAKRLAVICNLSGVSQVWTVPTEGGWPTQVTALDDQASAVEWSPTDPEVLAFSLAPGGGLNEQVPRPRDPEGDALARSARRPPKAQSSHAGTSLVRLIDLRSNGRSRLLPAGKGAGEGKGCRDK